MGTGGKATLSFQRSLSTLDRDLLESDYLFEDGDASPRPHRRQVLAAYVLSVYLCLLPYCLLSNAMQNILAHIPN